MSAPKGGTAGSPLLRCFPALAGVSRAAIGRYPTPVIALSALGEDLWIKRDDFSADPLGGNKARALEWLLGGIRAGDRVVTVGAVGSTHALAVATYARRLGASADVGRWRQVMNPTAARVSAMVERASATAPVFRSPVGAYAWAARQRLRGARWIPAGGSGALGIVGHVNAGLELAEQIARGELPMPSEVVLPLGTGGTAAGLALGFAIARAPIRVVAVRVVPRIVGRRARMLRLSRATARLIEARTGAALPRVERDAVVVFHHAYGGAYGKETQAGHDAAARLQAAAGIALDPTYSAKAFSVALDRARRAEGGDRAAGGPILFWLTFDSRVPDPTAPSSP